MIDLKFYVSALLLALGLSISSLAGGDAPLTVYLTWLKNPESTMTVHWISTDAEAGDVVLYRERDDEPWKKASGRHAPLPEGRDDLLVHTVEIIDLKADTIYMFKIGTDDTVHKFKTLPSTLTRPLRFVDGGDIYHDSVEILDRTNKSAASFDPEFAFLGGDIAYAADKFGRFPEDFSRWLAFLQSWETHMKTSDGRHVPVLPVTSNEDTKGRYDQTPEQAPFFYALFSMPGIQGYSAIDFGDYLTVFLLDSGHTHPIQGDQTAWLKDALSQREHFPHKFAVYHVPAYPSVRPLSKPVSTQVRTHWVPLFEQYNLDVAFEHHDHAYKRSVLIRNGQEDPTGVLYLGDGGYGVSNPRKPDGPNERWYIANSAQKTNFIVGTLYPNGERIFQAVDSEGNIFDEFTQ